MKECSVSESVLSVLNSLGYKVDPELMQDHLTLRKD